MSHVHRTIHCSIALIVNLNYVLCYKVTIFKQQYWIQKQSKVYFNKIWLKCIPIVILPVHTLLWIIKINPVNIAYEYSNIIMFELVYIHKNLHMIYKYVI